jgi:hypothetical protein
VMFREEARPWSIKFPVAPESIRAVETTQLGKSVLRRVWWRVKMMEYSHLPQAKDDHRIAPCSSDSRVRTLRKPLKLVSLLATIGTETQLSLTVSLSCGEACGPYLHGFRL